MQRKLMNKSFFKLKKSYFLAYFLTHSPILEIKHFSQNIWHEQLDKVF